MNPHCVYDDIAMSGINTGLAAAIDTGSEFWPQPPMAATEFGGPDL